MAAYDGFLFWKIKQLVTPVTLAEPWRVLQNRSARDHNVKKQSKVKQNIFKLTKWFIKAS